jgi:hypothetical protein
MRVFALLMFALILSYSAGTDSPYSKYPFAKYPARHYKGKLAAPRLITPTQREFRTVIRRGAVKGPNFAGHYTVAEWGCGSNCVVYAVIDAITGFVYDKGLPNPNEGYPCGLLYQRDSNLFVIEQSATIQSKCEPRLYVWRGSRFEAL